MPELAELGILGGVQLTLGQYRDEFRSAQWAIPGQESWKLERRQHFREPGFASWEAFARGEWDTALRLMEDEREYLAHAQNAAGDTAQASGTAGKAIAILNDFTDPDAEALKVALRDLSAE